LKRGERDSIKRGRKGKTCDPKHWNERFKKIIAGKKGEGGIAALLAYISRDLGKR